MKKCLYMFMTLASGILPALVFANFDDARTRLGSLYKNNPKVLEYFDSTVQSCEEFILTEESFDIEKLYQAVEFSAEKHLGQIRKDAEKTPYIVHPLGVAKLLWEKGKVRDINVLVSALLHDTLEDTDATESEIESLFGQRVKEIVLEVTNDPLLSSQENKQRQIDHAPSLSTEGKLVKLADRLYNVQDLTPPPPSWSKEHIEGYYSWGEKLLLVLKGTNEGLEKALQEELEKRLK